MRNSFIYLFCLFAMLFSTDIALAQKGYKQYNKMTAFLQHAINAGQSDSIYRMTSDSFRAKMSVDQFDKGMKKFMVKMGKWETFSYTNRDEKGLNYMATFELGRQMFSLRLNNKKQIERMNFAAVPVNSITKDYEVQSNNPLSDAWDRRIEQLVRPYIQKGITTGLVLAIVEHGKIRRYSYGTTDKIRTQLPDADSTLFEIGSVTKTFTSLLLAQQVVNGRMKLTDPINKYLPDSVPFLTFKGTSIQLVHLANHTSGFPRLPANIFNGPVDPANPYLHYKPDSLYGFLAHYRPEVEPGTVFSYSNFGAGLLGNILEKQDQMDFGQMVTAQISRPLGMTNTFVDIPERFRRQFAQGYNENGMPATPWNLASLKGSGAIRSTLNDMVRYVQAHLGGKSPLEESIRLMQVPTFKGPGQIMGLGWRIDRGARHTFYHHSGGTGGFRSFVGFDTSRQLGVVILSNTAEDVTAIGEDILKN